VAGGFSEESPETGMQRRGSANLKLREFSGQEKAFKFRIQHFPPLAELLCADFPGCN
jgi:hypothetical protein